MTRVAGELAAGLRSTGRGVAELVLPEACPACGERADPEQPFCAGCTELIDAIDTPCVRCGLPLATAPTEHGCLGCAREAPPWTRARVPFLFGGPLADAIRRWKLGREPAITRPLSRLLAPSLVRVAGQGGEVLVPVPLHVRRLRQREFNQASLLARETVRVARSGLPVREWLDRVVDTRAQMTLPAKVRRDNVKGAFRVARGAEVAGRHVVLVDDVVTTGATASACAQVLLGAGARRVDLLALARAVL